MIENNINPLNEANLTEYAKNFNQKFLPKAKDYWIKWLSSPITRNKFVQLNNGGFGFGKSLAEDFFPKYMDAIKNVKLVFYTNNMKSIPGYPQIPRETIANKDSMMFVNPQTEKVIFVNASVDNPDPIGNLIHEMTHLITLIYPFNPERKFEEAFSIGQTKKVVPDDLLKISSSKINSNPAIKKTATTLGLNPDDLKWLLVSALKNEKEDPGYTCGIIEKPANLMGIRHLFKLQPGKNITIEMIKPYVTGEKHNDNVYWILSCWALNGFGDLQSLLNNLNKLAQQDPNKKPNNTGLA